MLNMRAMAAGMIGLGLCAVGCGGAEPFEGGEAILAIEEGIIVMNGDDPHFFWQPSTQQALRALAQASLASSLGGVAPQPLLATPKGRALLGHVVGCALPAGETIQTSTGLSFQGAVGLAPGWRSSSLGSGAPSRWMTACLLQTLNGLGAHVPIRLSGRHPSLAVDAGAQGSGFTAPDATMFGDIFDPINPAAFACADVVPSSVCDLNVSASTLLRVCGQSPACGVTFTGLCNLSCSRDQASAPTCEAPGGGVYPEAIASNLQQNISLSLGEDCSLLLDSETESDTQRGMPSDTE